MFEDKNVEMALLLLYSYATLLGHHTKYSDEP